MKIRKIEHVGIACRDAEKAAEFYRGILGLPEESRETIEPMKLRVVKIRASETVLELLQPCEGEEVMTKFLAKNGEGIHHLCFEVDDIAAATTELREKGFAPVWEEAHVGAGNKWVNFLRPRDTGGVLIELNQPRP